LVEAYHNCVITVKSEIEKCMRPHLCQSCNGKRLKKEVVAHGLIMSREFRGFDATKYPVEHAMDSGMDMINNDQFYIIKLYDEKNKIEVYIAIRDLELLNKIPFSYNFVIL
jgi:excinuclease UvrABC ATPase subunit